MKNYKKAALYWFRFGLSIIPIFPGSKKTVCKWDPWLEGLDEGQICHHWEKHPDHEIGFIVGNSTIVFDTDTPESTAALYLIEKTIDITPYLVVKTSKGEHHYFALKPGTFAKSDSHSSVEHPDRIDVKTGRAMVVLPPSTGKSIAIQEVNCARDLSEVDQDFVDTIFRHNKRAEPRPPDIRVENMAPAGDCDISTIENLLNQLDPDCGYEDWTKVSMAIFHETGGSADGFELFNNWSCQGDKYPGRSAILSKWKSFRNDVSNPITIGTLIGIANDQGIDTSCLHEDFTISTDQETIVVHPEEQKKKAPNPLAKYSLTGMSGKLGDELEGSVYVIDKLALTGQMSVFYAAPNTGKTLCILKFLIESILAGRIDPNKLFYLNMDDTAEGLVTKIKIAEEFGINMLAPGYLNFQTNIFLDQIDELGQNDQARDTIIILDTLKKFVNLMDKTKSSDFNNKIRPFILKGGTVISLAHTNKNKQGGRSRYGGTSDMIDDSDCSYIIETISEKTDSNRKVIEFINEKRRGNVAENAAYSYDNRSETSYLERLLSVEPFDETEVASLRQNEALKADADIIETIKELIGQGSTTKMRLAQEAGKCSGVSRKSAIRIIEKYTGNDSKIHLWNYTVKARGKQVFQLLDLEDTETDNDFDDLTN